MRTIDADALKKHIDKLPALPDGNFAGNHSALKALINIQPTIEPEPHWIPCSERLPEHGGYYLVTEKISEECWFVGLAPYRSTCERWFGDHEVTAWMPLPEPYKEGE